MAPEPLRTLVCDKCLKASCWHGEFFCDDYQTAGLLRASEAQLRLLGREHPSYFMERLGVDDDPREPVLTNARVREGAGRIATNERQAAVAAWKRRTK